MKYHGKAGQRLRYEPNLRNMSNSATPQDKSPPLSTGTLTSISRITIRETLSLSGTAANGRRPKAPHGSKMVGTETYHQEEQYEYKKNANWYSTSSSSVTNETCKGKPNAPTPPWRKRGDIRSEKHIWCTANNWQQAQAGADPATAAAAAAADEAADRISISSSSSNEADEAYAAAAADASEATAAAKIAATAAVAAAAAAATAVATDAAIARASAIDAANAATAAVAKAKHKEEKYWKSYRGNEKKPHKTAKNSRFGYSTWTASTTLDEVLEEDEEDEIDQEHLSRGHCSEVLAGGNSVAHLDGVAPHSVSQQSRYSRYSSNFLSHVLIRIFVYFFWSIARLGDAPLADGRIRVSHAYPEV